MRTTLPPSTTIVRLASIVCRTEALGPGYRAVLWVQGCGFRCQGCIAPEWLPFEGGTEMTSEAAVSELLTTDVSGLTFSGGEPMEQAAALAEVAHIARQRRELDIICFTGYRYERLRDDPPNAGVTALLQQIDVLIDGPYVARLNSSIGLRGSSNQRIIHITSRLRHHDLEGQTRKVEVIMGGDSISMIGIPSPSLLKSLNQFSEVPFNERT